MSRTVAEVITSAAATMNDVDKVRYPEAEQIGFVVDALQMMRNARPDLFIGQLAAAIGPYTTASNLPIDEQYFRPVVDYVIARCESKDAEHVDSGRAALMAGMAQGFLR